MSEKEFGVKFTKLDHGFKIEVNGDEEIVNAHHEMAEAWREFMSKARQVAKAHHHHHQMRQGSYDQEVKQEDLDIQAE